MERVAILAAIFAVSLAIGACAQRTSEGMLSSNDDTTYSGSSSAPQGANYLAIDFSNPYRYGGNGGQ
jgi:hypothetical protein